MKSIRFSMLSSLALVLLGPCLGAGPAYAQGIGGKFTLPFEAHWGLATLQAGDYWFKLDRTPQGALQLYRGVKPVAFVYAQGFDEKTSRHAALRVVRENASTTVREMALPEIGMVLYYSSPKPKKGTALEERGFAMTVPIAITGEGR